MTIIALKNKYYLVSVTQFWRHVHPFCNNRICRWR